MFAVFLDYLDGSVARLKNMRTHRGAFFDPILDRVSESILYLSICIGQGELILILTYFHIFLGFTYIISEFKWHEILPNWTGVTFKTNNGSASNNIISFVKENVQLGPIRLLLLSIGAIEKPLLLPVLIIIAVFDALLLAGKMYLGFKYMSNKPN